MPFYEIEFPLACLSQEVTDDALGQIGALSVTYVDRVDDEPVLEPKPGEIRLWRDTLVRALFDLSTEPSLNLQRLGLALGAEVLGTARVRNVPDRAWGRVWLQDWKPMRYGRRLWVCPTSAEAPDDPDAVVVRLDPGLAFGTGSHPTTSLCLQVLDSLDLNGRTVIDYGCGSGVLGIAALKLGAARVLAVDVDPQALTATLDNAARNGVAAHILLQDAGAAHVDEACADAAYADARYADARYADAVHADAVHADAVHAEAVHAKATLPPSFCVLANILAGPLIELAPRLTAACLEGGHLILSGVLHDQAAAVVAVYAPGFDMLQVLTQDDWCCIHARRGIGSLPGPTRLTKVTQKGS
jgi:ribosomal protein L11 methyltransferase